ncbi:hypothetical protein SUGI_0473040 [Cryptomeria japonica]|nr:hypothetical protein SUGI_0473040 [Cryptomeria japonica]
MLARIFAQRRACTFFSIFSPGTMELQQDRRLISLFSVPGVGSAGEMKCPKQRYETSGKDFSRKQQLYDKGNKKLGASAGCLKEIQGGSRRRTKYAVEATAEHVGRSAKVLGMKSVVVRVKGSSYFGKKKAAVLSFRKGLGPRSNIMYIEDVTQLPHNGCRLPKRRRA